MSEVTKVSAPEVIAVLKSFIIGKMWLNGETNLVANIKLSEDLHITPSLRLSVGKKSIVINRNLPEPMTIKAGSELRFFRNNKREGKMDPDYTVSVQLENSVAENLINAQKAFELQPA